MNDISVTLSADDRALLQTLREAGVDIQQFARKGAGALRELEDSSRASAMGMEGLSGGVKSLVGALGGIATAATVMGIIKMADSVTTLQNQLKLATGGTYEAAVAYEELFAIAQRSRVSFTELGSTYASVSRAGSELGISQTRLLGVTEAIGNAMTIGGGSAQAMNAALVQLGQGLASGTLRGDELNSVMEQAPRLARALADGLNVSIGGLRKMGEEGEITAVRVIDALEKAAPQLAKEVGGAVMTAGQAFTVLGNSTVRFTGLANDATGATKGLADALIWLSETITAVGNNAQAMDGLRTTGEAVKVVWSDVAFVFERTGSEIGGIAAQIAAVLRGDFSGAAAIRAEMVADAQAARKALDAYQAGVLTRTTKDIGIDTSAETARLARHTAEMHAAEKQHRELAEIKQKLLGVDKDYLPTLTKLNDAYRSGALTQSEYVSLVGELAKKNYTAAKSTAAHADAFGDFVKKLNEKLAAQALELDAGRKLSDSEKLRIQFNEELGTKYSKLTAADLARVEALLKAIAAGEEQVRTTRRMVAAYQAELEVQAELDAAYVAESKAREAGRLAVDAYVQSIAESSNQVRLEQSLFGQSSRNRSIALEQYQIELDLKKQIAAINANQGFNQSQRDEEIAKATAAAAIAKASATAKADMAELQSLFDAFDNTAHDVFVNIFEDGSNAFKKLGQSLKAGLIDVLYQLTLKRWIISIGASVSGMGGSTLASAAGSGSNLLSGASTLATLAGGFNTASTLGAFGSGFVGSAASTLGFAEASSTLAASSAASTAAGFGGASSAGASLGAVAPYLAAATAIYYIAKKLDHSGTPHIGAGTSYSAATGLAQASAGATGGGLFSGITYSDSTQQMTTSLVQSIVGILDTTAVAFGKSAGYQAAASFADDSSKDGAWGSLVISKLGEVVSGWAVWAGHGQVFSDGAAGSAEYLAKVTADVRTALDQIGLPGWATSMLDKLGASPTLDQLAATVAEINKTETALVSMGKVLVGFSGMSDGAVSALIKTVGGIDALSAAAATYYDNFYTDAEKTANTTESVRAALAAVGLQMPATRAEFRALVEAQQALGEAGAPALATLLQMAGTFASVVPAASDLTTAVDDAGTAIVRTASDIADSIKNLKATGASLQVDLLTAQGDTQGAARLQRSIDIEGLTAEEVALYDFNAQIRALIDTTKAATEAAKAEAAQKTSLESTLLQALGETGTLRQRELAALPPANQALQNMIYTVTDAQSAITALNTDIARLDQIARQAATLSNSLSVLLGGTDNTEASLWATVNSASATAEDKLSAISSLMGIINNSITADTQAAQQLLTDGANAARTAIEQANAAQQSGAQAQLAAAQELVDFGRQLSDYVRSLQLGNVSTLTPGEKLAMAAQQYQSSLAGARRGDAASMQALQGNASTYLELARQYDPAAYSGSGGIFASVTGALGSFGGSLLTEGQQAALTAQATLDSIKSVSSSSATTASAVITGNVISDANRQSLQTLLDLSTQIEADAVIERAAKEAQRTEETARMEAIRTYLSDTGVIASSVSSTASVMNAFAMQQKADNAALVAEITTLRDEVVTLRAATLGGSQAVADAVMQSGAETAAAVTGAVATAIDEAAGKPVTI